MSAFIAVDTGGTFTDLVAFDPSEKSVSYTKSLTTHSNPLEGILDCVQKSGTSLTGARLFKHGTTLVVNTLIERSGPKIALVATKGFSDVVDLGRGHRTDQYDLFFRREPALVPRALRLELNERVDGQGNVLISPSHEDIAELAARIRALDVDAVAVSFLNAYVEPVNEQMVSKMLRELLPQHFVTAATDLSREWYEYERTSTATANAYTGPKITKYVGRLGGELGHQNFAGQFLIMGSNGGVLSPADASNAPVMLVESGPIGGCIGAAAYGKALGLEDVIAFDMGGTTAKCALVKDGKFDVVSTYYVGGYGRGIPIRTPVIDIVEVGAGGGSIAWLDAQTRVHVGPKSAGSMPGPVCYGRGGKDPTVTDANLVLGRLNADRFQGGEMRLDLDAAYRAIDEGIASPLGYTGDYGVLQAASGIIDLAVVTMSSAIKRITVERGKDPRDFALFAYGGGGPLHAGDLARELSIPQVIIPPEPGNFSAIGMLLADIRRDEGRTFLRALEPAALQAMTELLEEIEGELRRSLASTFGEIPIRVERYAEMRFVGQFHTVQVKLDAVELPLILSSFEATYQDRYGHLIRNGKVEFVSLHVAAFGETPRPALSEIKKAALADAISSRTREVFFTGSGRSVPAKVFAREGLPVGFTDVGPAIIEEYGSTTVVSPGDRFTIGSLGEISIAIKN